MGTQGLATLKRTGIWIQGLPGLPIVACHAWDLGWSMKNYPLCQSLSRRTLVWGELSLYGSEIHGSQRIDHFAKLRISFLRHEMFESADYGMERIPFSFPRSKHSKTFLEAGRKHPQLLLGERVLFRALCQLWDPYGCLKIRAQNDGFPFCFPLNPKQKTVKTVPSDKDPHIPSKAAEGTTQHPKRKLRELDSPTRHLEQPSVRCKFSAASF